LGSTGAGSDGDAKAHLRRRKEQRLTLPPRGGVSSSGDKPLVVAGEVVPTRDELFYRGYGVGGPDADSYAHMLARWAEHRCGIRDGIEAFCDTAARAGLIRDPHSSANDPWGIKANIHCLTGRGDCGEAIVADVLALVGVAFRSVAKALKARGASATATVTATAAAAAEAEVAAATFLKAACSFSPDTPVLLKDGKTKAISKVKPGDDVEAADPSTGKHKGPRPVIARLVNHDYDLVDVTVRAADGRTSTIHTTAKHPFWNDTLHAWTDAAHLQRGHLLNTVTDSHVQVVAVNDQAGSADMYNLTVDDLHTYYVLAGETPVLVHNASGDPVTPNIILRGLQQIQDGTLQQRLNPDGTPDFYRGGNNQKTAWWAGAKIYAPDPNNHDYRILEKNGQYKWVGPQGNQKGASHNYIKLMDITPRCP
jgi:hypothetical protein